MKKKAIIFSLLLAAVVLLPVLALATDTDVDIDTGSVGQTIDNITGWIVKISLVVALLMYVLGGFYWIIDNGNMESVKMAKSIIVSTTIGLIIILIANSLVNIVKTLVVK